MKLLIDENLSPTLVQRLADLQVAAVHVAHVGLAGASDPEVWRYAFENDQVVVTINAADFLYLARTTPVHAGLVVLRTHRGLSRVEQWAWVAPVVEWLLETGESLINRAVMVTAADTFSSCDLPEP